MNLRTKSHAVIFTPEALQSYREKLIYKYNKMINIAMSAAKYCLFATLRSRCRRTRSSLTHDCGAYTCAFPLPDMQAASHCIAEVASSNMATCFAKRKTALRAALAGFRPLYASKHALRAAS
ncbi:hypothetical protein NKJ28_32330 [Mesorhizobium sp. M0145]